MIKTVNPISYILEYNWSDRSMDVAIWYLFETFSWYDCTFPLPYAPSIGKEKCTFCSDGSRRICSIVFFLNSLVISSILYQYHKPVRPIKLLTQKHVRYYSCKYISHCCMYCHNVIGFWLPFPDRSPKEEIKQY